MRKTDKLVNTLFQPQSTSLWHEKLGWTGAQLFSLTAWFSIFFAQIGLAMMLSALIIEFPQAKREFKNSIVFWVSLAWLIYLAASALIAANAFPQTALSQAKAFKQFLSLEFFLLFAYWLNADSNRIKRVLFLALMGLILGIFLDQDWSKWKLILLGVRSGTEKWNYFTLGLYSATALIGVISFRHWFLRKTRNRWMFAVRITIWIFLVFIFLQGVIKSQERSVWIALIASSIILLIWYAGSKARKMEGERKKPLLPSLILLVGLICILLVAANTRSIQTRVHEATEDSLNFLAGNLDKIDPYSGVGVRIRMNIFGLRQWQRHPWFGWGTGTNANRFLAQQHENPVVAIHSHLHDTYLELLVRFGIVGTLIFSLLNLLVFLSFLSTAKNKSIGQDVFFTVMGAFLLCLIASLADYRLQHFDFSSYFTFFAGIAYTHKLAGSGNERFLDIDL